MYVYCVERFSHIECIWLNPFATVLYDVCSSVTEECSVCTRIALVHLECLLLCKEEVSSLVSLQLLRGRIQAL